MSARERCITWCDTAVFAAHEGFTPTVKTSASVMTVAREREKMDTASPLDLKCCTTSGEQRACSMYWWHYAKGAQSYTTVSSVFWYKKLQEILENSPFEKFANKDTPVHRNSSYGL